MAAPKCTYIFVAINRIQMKTTPIMLRVTATDEQSARQRFVSDYVLCFAGRLPVYRGHHGTI